MIFKSPFLTVFYHQSFLLLQKSHPGWKRLSKRIQTTRMKRCGGDVWSMAVSENVEKNSQIAYFFSQKAILLGEIWQVHKISPTYNQSMNGALMTLMVMNIGTYPTWGWLNRIYPPVYWSFRVCYGEYCPYMVDLRTKMVMFHSDVVYQRVTSNQLTGFDLHNIIQSSNNGNSPIDYGNWYVRG